MLGNPSMPLISLFLYLYTSVLDSQPLNFRNPSAISCGFQHFSTGRCIVLQDNMPFFCTPLWGGGPRIMNGCSFVDELWDIHRRRATSLVAQHCDPPYCAIGFRDFQSDPFWTYSIQSFPTLSCSEHRKGGKHVTITATWVCICP